MRRLYTPDLRRIIITIYLLTVLPVFIHHRVFVLYYWSYIQISTYIGLHIYIHGALELYGIDHGVRAIESIPLS